MPQSATGSLYNFCIKTFTYAEPDDVINGVEEEDLLKNYLNNYSYVSSRSELLTGLSRTMTFPKIRIQYVRRH